jgi:hypothetical protein
MILTDPLTETMQVQTFTLLVTRQAGLTYEPQVSVVARVYQCLTQPGNARLEPADAGVRVGTLEREQMNLGVLGDPESIVVMITSQRMHAWYFIASPPGPCAAAIGTPVSRFSSFTSVATWPGAFERFCRALNG